jgi:hypothetical protein
MEQKKAVAYFRVGNYEQIEKYEYEVINTITKDDIARVGDASIFVEESCGILKAMIEDDGKDITLYLLTCTTLEETFDYLTYKVYAELRKF